MVAGMAAALAAALAVLLEMFDIKECAETWVMHDVIRYGNTLIPVTTVYHLFWITS